MGRSAVEACATLLRDGLDAYAAAGTEPPALRERTAARIAATATPRASGCGAAPMDCRGTAVEGRRGHRPVRPTFFILKGSSSRIRCQKGRSTKTLPPRKDPAKASCPVLFLTNPLPLLERPRQRGVQFCPR